MRDSRTWRPTADQLGGAAIMAAFAFYGWEASKIQRSLTADVIGPGSFPLLVAGLGVVLGALLFLRSTLRREMEGPLQLDPKLFVALVPWFMTLGYAVGVYVIGFQIASALFLFFSVRWFSKVRVLPVVIFVLIYVGLVHYAFVVMLGMVLPEGILLRHLF